MDSFYFERTVLNWPITVRGTREGTDWFINISGGCKPHIGSVCAARYESGNVNLKKILFPTHRDDVVGDRFAEELARRFKTTVVVTCGIHYDNPGKEGLRQIINCTEVLLIETLEHISADTSAYQM